MDKFSKNGKEPKKANNDDEFDGKFIIRLVALLLAAMSIWICIALAMTLLE